MEKIRDYFLANARKIDPDINAKDKPLDEANIAQTDVDCAYHLFIGDSVTTERLNDGLNDVFLCKMKIYVDAGVCDNESYDAGYCKAVSIRNELVKASNIGDNDYITDVAPARIKPSSAGDNYKVFIFEINVNVSVVMCL